MNKVVSKVTVQASLISGFNKFDNCSYLLSSNFRFAFVSVASFSIAFDFFKTLYITVYITVLFLSSYVDTHTTSSKNSRFAVSKMQMHDCEKSKSE